MTQTKIELTRLEAQVLEELRAHVRPGEEINPRYLYPRRDARHAMKRRAILLLHEKGVLPRHPAVMEHFEVFALGDAALGGDFKARFKLTGDYDPHKVARRVRLQNAGLVNTTGNAVFASKSMTKRDGGDCYRPTINIESGAAFCNCWHFHFRLARHNPNVWSPREHLCKHLLRAMENLERRKMLPQQDGRFGPACSKCGVLDADDYFEVCDERGHAIAGKWICCDCAHSHADDLGDVPAALAEPGHGDDTAFISDQAAVMYEAEHPPCLYCACPTNEIEIETGYGLSSERHCDECGVVGWIEAVLIDLNEPDASTPAAPTKKPRGKRKAKSSTPREVAT